MFYLKMFTALPLLYVNNYVKCVQNIVVVYQYK